MRMAGPSPTPALRPKAVASASSPGGRIRWKRRDALTPSLMVSGERPTDVRHRPFYIRRTDGGRSGSDRAPIEFKARGAGGRLATSGGRSADGRLRGSRHQQGGADVKESHVRSTPGLPRGGAGPQ